MAGKTTHLENLATILRDAVNKNLTRAGKITFSEEPLMEIKNLIEYDHKMRVSGLEKFNGPGYVIALSFYRSVPDKEKHNACGALVLYLEEEFIENLLKVLGHTGIDEDDEPTILKLLSEFGVSLTEQFKEEISSLGYRNLVISEAMIARNTIADGIDFSYDQYDKSEISFRVKGQKVVVVELTMTTP